jgi:hypothetical protein
VTLLLLSHRRFTVCACQCIALISIAPRKGAKRKHLQEAVTMPVERHFISAEYEGLEVNSTDENMGDFPNGERAKTPKTKDFLWSA